MTDRPGSSEPGDLAFLALRDHIAEETGLATSHYKQKYLKRRIAVRMRRCGVDDYTAYRSLLEHDGDELRALLRDLTINVTQFYRDPSLWDRLRSEVLPLIIYDNVRSGRGRLRLWSAGCASGEEPHTLAMIVLDLLGADISSFQVEILATDIDTDSLERARDGVYALEQLRTLPADLRAGLDLGVKSVTMPAEVHRLIDFRHLDLFAQRPQGPFDLITCRNVFIYFSRDMQQRCLALFHDLLRPGGFLILGKTETMFPESRVRFDLHDARERIYRRPEE